LKHHPIKLALPATLDRNIDNLIAPLGDDILYFTTCHNAERLQRQRIGIPLIRASICDKHFLTVNQLPAPFVPFGTAPGSRLGEEPVFAGSTALFLENPVCGIQRRVERSSLLGGHAAQWLRYF